MIHFKSKVYVNMAVALLLFPVFLSACSTDPEPIAFGKDHCGYCKMTIADTRFGGELVTTKGKVYKFDAMECLLPYMNESKEQEYAHILGVAYDDPGNLLAVKQLHFVISEEYPSPMGAHLAGFQDSPPDGKESLTWKALQQQLSEFDPANYPE
ncbi:nitrous oxide reductase accessory protein NosL [Cyclobacterium sp. SYSU L10401]|uniref:nitrous oxide reductase accessory protein NosL n=1 Tax=Cyclobacterium sp. SYSU L10401 TaxID=2678657 RepID=UPI0013D6A29F|nr:nitrous oxide reductase accessory protein NosL [Cyclobacterium sp. SYSU L10401]